jgi:two-component system, LytTR family, response regulator
MIRALVVDDEALAREGIRLQLERETDISIVGEAGDGPDAVDAIARLRPDLVFLDIEIPGFDGFEVLRRVSSTHLPTVIFVTAYDHYAVRAFDARAVDYLMKPLSLTRFQETLHRVRLALTSLGDGGRSHQRLIDRIESRDRPGTAVEGGVYYRRFTVKEGFHFLVVKASDVDWFEAASNYVQLHVHGREHLLRVTLSDLEEKLDPSRFVRIHRSTIVNLDRVIEIRPTWHGDFIVLLNVGTTLRLSRVYRDRLMPSKWLHE